MSAESCRRITVVVVVVSDTWEKKRHSVTFVAAVFLFPQAAVSLSHAVLYTDFFSFNVARQPALFYAN